ncbi:DUF4345 domain-containing protein [Bailinhaonella thermotolerans]|nr:DUF4345 domain-containing protein [Bailinhaonella thermotolerans]
MTARRAFQGALVLLGLVIVGTAGIDLALGPFAVPGDHRINASLDNNYRFFAGVWLALGLVLLSAVRRAPHATGAVRVVCAATFAGGLARLLSLAAAGASEPLYLAFIGIELVVPAALVLWQNRLIARDPAPAPA